MPNVTMDIQDARRIATLAVSLTRADSRLERAAAKYGKRTYPELEAAYLAAAYEDRAEVYNQIADLQAKFGVVVIASNARMRSARDLQSSDKYRGEAEI